LRRYSCGVAKSNNSRHSEFSVESGMGKFSCVQYTEYQVSRKDFSSTFRHSLASNFSRST
jgi:hypothetical protein